MQNNYKLYGHEVSLFSGKTRAYLRYKNIPFTESLSAENRAEVKQHIGRSVIPVVRTPLGDYLQDTTVIIDALEQQFPDKPVYPTGPFQKLVSLLMEVYAEEWLILPAMHYRWAFKRQNLWFILKEFGDARNPDWPNWAKPIGAIPPALFFGTLYKPFFGLTAAMEKEVEQSYVAFLKDFDRHLQDHDYLLGERPSIGDFGLIAPLYAHLGRDPYPKQLMQNIAPNVYTWTKRMQSPPKEIDGAFLPDDKVPETLYPILTRMFKEQFPPLAETIKLVAKWAEENPNKKKLPRTIGKHTFTVGKTASIRRVFPFQQWMFQRPLDFYQGLDKEQKDRIDPALKKLGGYKGLQQEIPVRLDFLKHRLVRT